MLPEKKHAQALQLVSQMLDIALEEDQNPKAMAIQNHKGSPAIGESFWVFHLKALKDLLSEEQQ